VDNVQQMSRSNAMENRPAAAAGSDTNEQGFSIAKLWIPGRAVLAPLAGVSDWPFRTIARAHGAPLAYTEMVSAEGLIRGGAQTHSYLTRHPSETPFAVQLFGARPSSMAHAARLVEEVGADLIDVNLGCPVKKVCRGGAGAAMLQDPSQIEAVVAAMTAAVQIPVQIKVRLGWTADSINVVEVAKRARDGGASGIAIHGRTRAQGYDGLADWGPIAEVKRQVPELTVIGNGDIKSAEEAYHRLQESGVDAVMIGRGACGNPWIFEQCRARFAGEAPPPAAGYEAFRAVIEEHLDGLIQRRAGDEGRAVREFRALLGWYSRGRKGATAFRSVLKDLNTREDVERALDRFLPPSDHHALAQNTPLETGPLNRAWG